MKHLAGIKEFFDKRILTKEITVFDVTAVGVVLATHATLAFSTIAKFSIWFDEAFSAYIARFDFWQIAVYTAQDVQPPLYYWLLKIWTFAFGNTELGVRSLSVLFGGVAVIFAYLLLRRLFNKYAAFLAVVFMVLSPLFIRYSQEARMYMLVAAITFTATYVLVVATQTKQKKAWIWYSVLVALGMWTHYFTALVWIAHIAWHGWSMWQPGQKWKQFKKVFFAKEWVRAYGLAALLYIPWVPAFLLQTATVQVAGFWIPPIAIETIPNFISNVFLFREIGDMNAWLFVCLAAVILIGGASIWQAYRHVSQRRYLNLLICIAIIPIVLLALASLPPLRPIFIDRYIITSALTIPLLFGIGIVLVRMKTGFKVVASLLVAGAFLTGTLHVQEIGNYNKNTQLSNSTRQVLESIYSHGSGGEPIIADSPWLFYEAVFYTKPEHPVYFLNASIQYPYGSLEMLKQNEAFKIHDLAIFAKEHPSFWYVSTLTEDEKNPPLAGLREVQQIVINDAVSTQPLYRAVQYVVR